MPHTAQEFEMRKRVLEEKDIKKLFQNYNKKFRNNDLVGANKIAWILSAKYGIEGDRSYAIGSSQE